MRPDTASPLTPAPQPPSTSPSPVATEGHDEKPAPAPVSWKTFRGDFFDVEYPGDFKARPTDGKDGVLCTSPDGLVAFYIYSPQWNGKSQLYAIDGGEVLKQQSTEVAGSRRIVRVTYQRKADGHIRAFEDVEDTLTNTRRTFGVFYASPEAYAHHKDDYLRFKRSLKQYAD